MLPQQSLSGPSLRRLSLLLSTLKHHTRKAPISVSSLVSSHLLKHTMSGSPKVLSRSELPASEAKWVTLQKINWQDPTGKQRVWESAERKTRGKSGIDAVAIFAMIRSQTKAFPLSTVVIEQYRPPIDKYVIELPAGLIDEGESPEEAAIRELEEETGLKAKSVIEDSPIIVSDPGMSNANMKLVLLDVLLPDKLDIPEAKLDEGEFITKRVVEINKLADELKDYDKKGFVVDARLFHLAAGVELAMRIANKEFA